ncbi:hypothetical protein, partial [Streptomyces sp. NPDC024089]|uniref:hypothetical protein n=1 Tax=Streptomyces sp. NPDC024089 TaxID=3154328 RepID=UPI0033F94627
DNGSTMTATPGIPGCPDPTNDRNQPTSKGMEQPMKIDGVSGFHIEREAIPVFTSDFTRWIEQRSTDQAYPGLIEMLGVIAREHGLAEDEVDLVARMTGTTPETVVREYRRDNTAWAEGQARLVHAGLAGLDEHLDEIARQH